ncbi:tyrosine-protein phosphatase [Streptacidiphilus anmyonensis]|uniref:tyrosine-protein phosphatase n=1 Tax=Streptacidiphilus anmyonensis TaxID=405782 RepID=UPI0005A6CB68|nr:tyrosine-protein phosphatase [Streptacidiphilus anmyonensis]
MSISGAERLILIPGVRNLRDAGGFPTTGGARVAEALLYRAGSLHELTTEGAERLAALGLRTIIDLRSAPELEVWPDHPLDGGVRFLHLPTFPPRERPTAHEARDADVEARDADAPDADALDADTRDGRDAEAGEETLEDLYAFMSATAGPAIAAAVSALAVPGALPALIHCAVGKDRTGVTVATLLSALGVSDADILADYHLSNAGLGLDQGPVYYVDEHGTERRSRPVHVGLMSAFLASLRASHGDATRYLLAHGVTEAELSDLRAAFRATGGDGRAEG